MTDTSHYLRWENVFLGFLKTSYFSTSRLLFVTPVPITVAVVKSYFKSTINHWTGFHHRDSPRM